ncbi:MAG: hypothetical protein ABIT82_00480 [Ramlibacter sp.]
MLGDQMESAMLFRRLATLRTDAKLFKDVTTLRWRGPTRSFAQWTQRIAAPKLLVRCLRAKTKVDADVDAM